MTIGFVWFYSNIFRWIHVLSFNPCFINLGFFFHAFIGPVETHMKHIFTLFTSCLVCEMSFFSHYNSLYSMYINLVLRLVLVLYVHFGQISLYSNVHLICCCLRSIILFSLYSVQLCNYPSHLIPLLLFLSYNFIFSWWGNKCHWKIFDLSSQLSWSPLLSTSERACVCFFCLLVYNFTAFIGIEIVSREKYGIKKIHFCKSFRLTFVVFEEDFIGKNHCRILFKRLNWRHF